MSRKQCDSRLSEIWGTIVRLRDRDRDAIRAYYNVNNSEVSKKFPIVPNADQYPNCKRFLDAISTINELIDVFGIEILAAIAKEHGCSIVNPEHNREQMIQERIDRLNEIRLESGRLKDELKILQTIGGSKDEE